jgi:riboflavin kinase/FMN adenylyltransferase
MDALEGTVVHGDGYARTIGWPTANLEDISGDLPDRGLYLAHVNINGVDYFGGLLIDEKKELFLIKFEGNLYGLRLSIDVLKKIKDIDDVNRENHIEDLELGLKEIEKLNASF